MASNEPTGDNRRIGAVRKRHSSKASSSKHPASFNFPRPEGLHSAFVGRSPTSQSFSRSRTAITLPAVHLPPRAVG